MKKRALYGLALVVFLSFITDARSSIYQSRHRRTHATSKETTPKNISIMKLSEITPSMTGYGLTIFAGTKPQKFGFKVLGIVDTDTDKPLIFAEIYGGPGNILAKTKAAEGMSGSPMYVQGNRLIGALAYGHKLSTEAHCYITPIESMLNFQPRILKLGQKHKTRNFQNTLEPGETYFVLDIWGDDHLGSFGTVTYVDPLTGLIYGMGHPIADGGSIELAIRKALVIKTLPILDSSVKIAKPIGPVIGTMMALTEPSLTQRNYQETFLLR